MVGFEGRSKTGRRRLEKECNKTGGGSNRVQQPSELHYRIIQIIGEQSVAGIEGASGMEVARPTTSGNKYF